MGSLARLTIGLELTLGNIASNRCRLVGSICSGRRSLKGRSRSQYHRLGDGPWRPLLRRFLDALRAPFGILTVFAVQLWK
jgi:hypothetical protein